MLPYTNCGMKMTIDCEISIFGRLKASVDERRSRDSHLNESYAGEALQKQGNGLQALGIRRRLGRE